MKLCVRQLLNVDLGLANFKLHRYVINVETCQKLGPRFALLEGTGVFFIEKNL